MKKEANYAEERHAASEREEHEGWELDNGFATAEEEPVGKGSKASDMIFGS